MKSRPIHSVVIVAALLACTVAAQTLPKVTTPKQALGFNIGADYQMATYTQLETYWKKLPTEGDRKKQVRTRTTEGGRAQWMAVCRPATATRDLHHEKEI